MRVLPQKRPYVCRCGLGRAIPTTADQLPHLLFGTIVVSQVLEPLTKLRVATRPLHCVKSPLTNMLPPKVVEEQGFAIDGLQLKLITDEYEEDPSADLRPVT